MKEDRTLIFLPLRGGNINLFRHLYKRYIKDVPGILELVDISNNDGTLLTWLCRLNLNDLLHKCFDKINPINFNTKDSKEYTPLLYMIKHARCNLDTKKILLRFLTKYHDQQPLSEELFHCLPNVTLLKNIIILYEGNEHLLVYDSIINSEILYDKEKYDIFEQQHIKVIFRKILENDKAFKHTNILMNAIKFNNKNIFDKIIENSENIKPLIDKSTPINLMLVCLETAQKYNKYYLHELLKLEIFKSLIQQDNSGIIDEIVLLFHYNMNVKYLIDQLGIDQPKIDCIYNKIITRPSLLDLETINSYYQISNYKLIKYLWTNSDRNQEKFEYVNSKTHDKYITEFGCLKNNGGSSIMKEFIDLGMCETRPVENTDQVYMSKLAWAKEHIANPDNILAKTGIRFEHLKHSIKICNYIFYCYDYTTCKIICIGTLLNPRDDKSYELDALCVDSKYPGLGTNFMNYIKKITKQLNQYESTKIKLSAIPRYETVRFYKDKAGFDFTDKDKHGKAILNERLYEMDVTYKKYLKYKAKYMNLRKKLST